MYKHNIKLLNNDVNSIVYFNSRCNVSLILNGKEVAQVDAHEKKVILYGVSERTSATEMSKIYQFLIEFCVIPYDELIITNNDKKRKLIAYIYLRGSDKYEILSY